MEIAKAGQNNEPKPVQSELHNDEKSPSPPDTTKKSKKEDKLKKDDKSVEQFMKTMNSIPTLDEKFAVVCKKYVQSTEENKKLQFYNKQSDKRFLILLKEKEHLQHEFNKNILLKSKLENLCRELQKQNKAIKEESLQKIREEEERRKETQAKFQNTLSEITTLLQQNNEKNAKLRDDNISMTEKFKSVVQQYQLREQQVDKMAKQMALESQLSDAKLQKASLEHQAEKERLLAEMEQFKVNMAQYKTKIMEQQATETALKGQLAIYTDKYDEFQNALVKSNQVFGGFKEQMELMSKKIKALEKECLSWKKRWEVSQTALLDMCSDRQANEERVSSTGRQLQHMQSLCRTLQAERAVLLNTLKEHNIERPPLPTPPPAPAPSAPAPATASPANNNKMDAMVANCAQLRQSLAHLQTQLNVLTTNKNGGKEEAVKLEPKQKKNKSKKNKQKQDKEEVKSQGEIENTNAEAEIVDGIEPTPNNTEPDNTESEAPIAATEHDDVNTDKPESEIDELTMESLIQVINLANKQYLNNKDPSTEEKSQVNEDKPAITEFVNTPAITEDVNTPAITEDVNTPAITEDVNTPAITEDVNTPAITEDVNTPAITEDVNTLAITEDVNTPAITEDVNTPAITEDVNTLAITEDVNTPAITEDVNTPAITEDVNTPADCKEDKVKASVNEGH